MERHGEEEEEVPFLLIALLEGWICTEYIFWVFLLHKNKVKLYITITNNVYIILKEGKMKIQS
jgi:hypothetical protein